jgi:hypothetical protein
LPPPSSPPPQALPRRNPVLPPLPLTEQPAANPLAASPPPAATASPTSPAITWADLMNPSSPSPTATVAAVVVAPIADLELSHVVQPLAKQVDEAEAARQTLGVSASATEDEIKSAYHRQSREHHPDKGGSVKAQQNCTAAYQVLVGNQRQTCRKRLGVSRRTDRLCLGALYGREANSAQSIPKNGWVFREKEESSVRISPPLHRFELMLGSIDPKSRDASIAPGLEWHG